MKPKIHVMLCDDIGERFFGEGPCRLLHRIEETGSLRAAAQAMGLSYSKALRMVKRAEKELGFALTRKTIGGRGGGGSTLTDEARNFMERYEAYRDACVQTDRELYDKFFPGERYAQFDSLVRALPDFPKELLRGNIDYCDKVFQWTLLPRIILIFCTFFFTILVTLVSPYSSIKWWILAFALFLALFTAIPGHLLNKQLLRAIFQLPSLLLGIASNLFKLKGVNKKFIHTEHGN